MKSISKENMLLISLPIIIFSALLFMFLSPFEDPLIVDSMTRFFYSIAIIIMIILMKYDILNPFQKKRWKTLFVAVPALLISLNNFPIIAFLNGQATLHADAHVYAFLLQCISVGLLEELIFRGLLLTYLLDRFKKHKYGIMKAIVISALIFGFIHLLNLFSGASIIPTLLQVSYSILTGLMWATLIVITKNIWIGAILHALYNFTGLLFPTLGIITNQFDTLTIIITISLSVLVAIFYANKLYQLTFNGPKKDASY